MLSNKAENNGIKSQFFYSIIIGGIASFIDIVIFLFLFESLQIHYLLANLISFSIGLVTNYLLTIKWVFTQKSSKKRSYEFFQYFLVAIIGLLFAQLILWLCIDIFIINALISKIIATLIAFIWNFLARKYYVF